MLRIEKTEFEGHAAVEIRTAKARLVAVTDVGPRIAWFGSARGRNLLFWDRARKYRHGDWFLRGGHRVWLTRPGADEAEETYAPDNAPCAVRLTKRGFRLDAPEHPGTRTARSLEVRVEDDATFTVANRVANPGTMLWSGGAWGLTCTAPAPGCAYGVPLGDGSEWDVFSVVIPKRWAGGQTSRVNDPQIRFTEDCLVLKPAGVQAKRMVQAPRGIIGMTDPKEKLSFLKRLPYERGGAYPLGTNIAFYVGRRNFMVEMETMGPERTVAPGGAATATETWALRPPVDWGKYRGQDLGI